MQFFRKGEKAPKPTQVKFKYPFRIGRHLGRAILDAEGLEVVIFPEGREDLAVRTCEFLNKEELLKLTGKEQNDWEMYKDIFSGFNTIENAILDTYK